MTRFARDRDYYAGALIALIGAGAIYQGWQYGVGGLSNMGSGFFPVALGIGMVLLGALMAATGTAAPEGRKVTTPEGHKVTTPEGHKAPTPEGLKTTTPEGHAATTPDWRGASAIAIAVALFIGLANTAGLAPATFACVFAAALGTRSTRVREALLLAAGVTVFGVLLFSFGLQVQFPILRGAGF